MAADLAQSRPRPTYKLREARLFGDALQPWRSGPPDLRAINPIPSMICEDESRFLHWIAGNHVSGAGCIVDLGPLAGGSTHALCSGLALNPRAAGRTRVHAYDLWRFQHGWEPYFPGARLRAGDNLQPMFAKNLLAYSDVVVSHPGGLRKHRWSGDPIEVLFVDAAKSAELWDHTLTQFLPYCIPGRTLIVQQDWACAECPWIHLTTARLPEYFAPVDSPAGGSVAFLLLRPVPRALLDDGDFLTQPLAQAVDLFERAASWMVGWYGLCVRLAAARYLVMRGRTDDALDVVNRVLAHPDFRPQVQRDADLVLAAIDSARKPFSRLRDACAGTMRRALTAIGAKLG